MINHALSAFLDRIHTRDDQDGLYLRVKAGASRRKSELVHSNIPIVLDSESMFMELQGYLEGWVWEEGEKCFIELMRARHTNPLDVVALEPADIIDLEDEDPEDYIEESAVKTLTAALVEMAKDCNHRATVSQERFLHAVEVMVDSQIEMAHAQAQLAVEKEETPAWVTALSAISPAFGPLVGDLAKRAQEAKPPEEPPKIETEKAEDEENKPPVVASPPQPNPFDLRG